MKVRIVTLALMVWALTGAFAYGAEGTSGDYMRDIGTKFGRGLVNVVTSPAEIPCTMSSDMKDRGGAGFFMGFGKGMAFMGRRILVGVCEVGTFMIPMEATLPPVCKKAEATVS